MAGAAAVAGGTREGERSSAPPASLWRNRIVLILGIVLLGITLRHAVTGLSPLLVVVREDLGIGVTGASIIGTLPTLSFGAAGFLAAVLIRRLGAERTAALAMLLAGIGTAGRAFTDSVGVFLVLSTVALVGMGFGNVVGAPLVKKYFSDRQAPMLTVFTLLMQAGATLPAITAVPIANAADWRVSLASWSLLSFAAAVPWVVQLVRMREPSAASAAASAGVAGKGDKPRLGVRQLVKNPIAVGTALFYAMASLNTYAMLAWLPTILNDRGMDLQGAATAFSVYTFLTLPMAFLTPLLATKLDNPLPLAVFLSLVHPVGYLGLVLVPDAPLLWTAVMGLGGGAFPLAITMFNLRTRTSAGSGALGGFAMGVGYLFGTLGPLMGGALFSATGGWTAALIAYAATGPLMVLGATVMTKRGRYLEDKLEPAIGRAG